MSIGAIFLVIAVICFFLAAIEVPLPSGRMVAIGLFFFALASLVAGVSLKGA
jgi:hypothetical protein